MPLTKVTDLTYERSPLGRLLGYGTFIMESAGQDQALSRVDYLRSPDRLYQRLSQQMFGPGGRRRSQHRGQSVGHHRWPAAGPHGPPSRWSALPGSTARPGRTAHPAAPVRAASTWTRTSSPAARAGFRGCPGRPDGWYCPRAPWLDRLNPSAVRSVRGDDDRSAHPFHRFGRHRRPGGADPGRRRGRSRRRGHHRPRHHPGMGQAAAALLPGMTLVPGAEISCQFERRRPAAHRDAPAGLPVRPRERDARPATDRPVRRPDSACAADGRVDDRRRDPAQLARDPRRRRRRDDRPAAPGAGAGRGRCRRQCECRLRRAA